jgi:hypothetical protein
LVQQSALAPRDVAQTTAIAKKIGTSSLVVRDLEAENDATVTLTALDFRTPTGTTRVQTIDRATRKPVTARVSIRQDDGKFVYPPASLHRMLGGTGHLDCGGAAEFEVPAGRWKPMPRPSMSKSTGAVRRRETTRSSS